MAGTLTWLGHSAFRVDSPGGKRIYVDPFLNGNPKCPENEQEPERVDIIAVTHAHGDHYTQAVALRQTFGTRVRIGRGERASIERLMRGDLNSFEDQYTQLRRYGAAELLERLQRWTGERYDKAELPWDRPDGWLDDGDRIALYDRALDVIATPGHTQGHVVLRDAAAGLLFAGDHILPHITPSIGFEPVPTELPLRAYLHSLELVRQLPDMRLLPAHGPVTGSVHARVDELLDHHGARLDACGAAVESGRRTAHEVAATLAWTRRRRRIDELDLFNQMLATAETEVHLELLAAQGRLARSVVAGVVQYDPAG